jgi:hypothetical protein
MNVTNLPAIAAGQTMSHINLEDLANPKLETLYVITVNFNPTRDVLEVTLENVDGLKPQTIDINGDGEITSDYNTRYYLTAPAAVTAFNAYIDERVDALSALNDANDSVADYLISLKH